MGIRILLVEGDKALRETLAYSLTQTGYQVVQSSDGLDALEQAHTGTFQLIVLDITASGCVRTGARQSNRVYQGDGLPKPSPSIL